VYQELKSIEEHKNNRVVIYQRLLDLYANESEAFLKRIVTGDEKWVLCIGKQMPEHGMETSRITSEEEIQESNLLQEK
jgi:hypothetical protein